MNEGWDNEDIERKDAMGEGLASVDRDACNHRSPEDVEGMDFRMLPESIRAAIQKRLFGVGQEWGLLNDFIAADPGRKIAVARSLRRMSQKEVARRAKVRQADVSNAETDFYKVKFGVLKSIVEAVGLDFRSVLLTSGESTLRNTRTQAEDCRSRSGERQT